MSLSRLALVVKSLKASHSLAALSQARCIGSAVQRGSEYAELNQEDVAAFTDILGSSGVVQDETALAAANE